MTLTIFGRHLEVTPAIREYVTTKLTRALHHFYHVIDTQVTLSVEPLKHKAEVTMRLSGKDILRGSRRESLFRHRLINR